MRPAFAELGVCCGACDKVALSGCSGAGRHPELLS